MAKRLGDNIQLFVKDASGDAYSKPGGQGNLTINRNSSPIDTSDKNSGRYGSSIPGQDTVSLTQAIQPDLPDATFTRLKTLAANQSVINLQAKDITGSGGGTVLFQADMYVSFGNSDAPQGGVVATTLTATLASAPTIDLL